MGWVACLIAHLPLPAGAAGADQVEYANNPPSIAQAPPFSVHWPTSDDRGHIAVSRTGVINASVHCASQLPCELDMLISGDNGRGTVQTVALGTIQVEPLDRVTVEVRPEALGYATFGSRLLVLTGARGAFGRERTADGLTVTFFSLRAGGRAGRL